MISVYKVYLIVYNNNVYYYNILLNKLSSNDIEIVKKYDNQINEIVKSVKTIIKRSAKFRSNLAYEIFCLDIIIDK